MGPASEAAGILFSEFNRLGVLEAQFYENDSIFAARKKYEADPGQRARFEQQLGRAEDLAKFKLSRDARDRDALLAMTFASGLPPTLPRHRKAQFGLASLHQQATAWAGQLLAADPNCYDAHLAGGVSRYIIGSMAAPVCWVLRLGALRGIRLAASPNSRRPQPKAISSPHSRASCWPSPTSARRSCRARVNSCWRCNETFPTTLSLAGN